MTSPDTVAAALPAYDIGREIGRGGWGVVLSGRHRQLEREVAIKQLPPSFASDATIRARFRAEARLLASLDHPHVVPVYDFVEQDGLCVLVMELLPGGSVWSRFTSAGFTPQTAVAVALACAAGLKAAHDRGILHRDIKPENLMFAPSGALKVTDFGIAKVVGGGETLATKAGDVLGTPAYMAPEQARGAELSPATDIYALSTMLYELLAGQLPFPEEGDAMAVLFRHAFEEPVPLLTVAPAIPSGLASVVMQGLATDPAARFTSAEDFGSALNAASTGLWGGDWLQRQTIPVLGADTVTSSAVHAPATRQSAASIPPPPGVEPTIRPKVTVRAPVVALADVAAGDLVPVQKVVAPSARTPAIVAGVLAVAAVLLALLGLGQPSSGGSLKAHRVTVDGHVATTSGRVPLDLTRPVSVKIDGVTADKATVTLDVLGIGVRSVSAPVRAEGGASVASLPAVGGRFIVGGNLSARLDLKQGDRTVGSSSFGVKTTQPAVATAVAAADVVLLLFTLAYVESLSRSLRRYRSRFAGLVGLPVVAALLGVALAVAAWVLLGTEPTVPALFASAVLGGAAGGAGAIASLRVGKRKRYARRAKKRTAA